MALNSVNEPKQLDIIGIGGSSAPLNPRLPAYLIPSLQDPKSNLLLVSSVNGAAEYNAKTPEESELIYFNTQQKLQFLRDFTQTFYPHKKIIAIDYSLETDNISLDKWIYLWNKFESLLNNKDKAQVYDILTRYNQSDSLEKAKAYAIRHSFWFKDLSLKNEEYLKDYSSIQSIGGVAESFFSFIREKVDTIPSNELEDILQSDIDITRTKIQKVMYPFEHQVVPYGEATRGKHEKRHSIEYQYPSNTPIEEHYNGKYQQKAGLNTDIAQINKGVGKEKYQDFWNDFQKSYTQEHTNL